MELPSYQISPQLRQALEELHAIKNDPTLRALHLTQKPIGYSKKSNMSYYKPKFGLEFRAALDTLLADGKPHGWAYQDHAEFSKNTLYARVMQGKMYLLDHMDPDKFYAIAMDRVAVSRERGRGIILTIVPDKQLVARPMLNTKEMSAWKHRLEEWLMNGPEGSEFVQEQLLLSEADIEELTTSLSQLGDSIGFNITYTSIKLRKF